MSRRSLIIIGFGAVIVIGIVALIVASSANKQASTPSVQYTDAITGQPQQVLTIESTGTTQMPGSILPPRVTIAGFDAVSTMLDNVDQISSLQSELQNFLFAHAGMTNVRAGIKAGSLSQPTSDSITFTLVVIRPQATYQVKAQLDNDYNLVKNVTFKQVE